MTAADCAKEIIEDLIDSQPDTLAELCPPLAAKIQAAIDAEVARVREQEKELAHKWRLKDDVPTDRQIGYMECAAELCALSPPQQEEG